MRCLYCGKELALLKRLTRGGEFCSDAHKQSYQEEYNRLGLSRLLQAQSKTVSTKPSSKTTPPPPIAPPVTKEPEMQELPGAKVVAASVAEMPPVPIDPPEHEPPAILGFSMEKPSISGPPDPLPYVEHVEPWLDPEAGPLTLPVWPFDDQSIEHPVFGFPLGNLLPLAMHPGVGESQHPMVENNTTPREFASPRVNLGVSLTVASSHTFPSGGIVTVEVVPRPWENAGHASLNGALDFPIVVDLHACELLELTPAGIAFPAEDSEVTVPSSWTNGITTGAAVDITVPAIPSEIPDNELLEEQPSSGTEGRTPRAALEALSKLHQNMKVSGEAVAPAGVPPAKVEPPEKLVPPEPAPSPAEPVAPAPREASELLAISLKSFAPPKSTPDIVARALLGTALPVLPRLKALPLRAKVAPAPQGFGQRPQSPPAATQPQESKAKGSAPNNATLPAEAKPAVPSKPQSAEVAQKPAEASKPKDAPKSKESPKSEVQAAKPPLAAEAAKVKQPTVAQPAKVEQPKASPAATAQVKASEPAQSAPEKAPSGKQATKAVPPAAGTPKAPETTPAEKTPVEKKDPVRKIESVPVTVESTPNFGAVVNTSAFGSLRVKLGIAALLAVVGAGAYFGLAGKSSKTAVNASASADGVGPSIMVGEGGWVEGWGTDPIGLHTGRQITFYRPSLKLTDYRIEFLGQIESKSIGWVFRAADPENYYAMKLVLVSPELPLTVALYKYIVIKGRQIQVGRVPIEVPVKNDTIFKIRVDVRGPKFNTYVQSQPVDVWTDDQLRSGGVGFLNERMERSRIKSVSLSYLTGGTK